MPFPFHLCVSHQMPWPNFGTGHQHGKGNMSQRQASAHNPSNNFGPPNPSSPSPNSDMHLWLAGPPSRIPNGWPPAAKAPAPSTPTRYLSLLFAHLASADLQPCGAGWALANSARCWEGNWFARMHSNYSVAPKFHLSQAEGGKKGRNAGQKQQKKSKKPGGKKSCPTLL